MVSLKLIKQQFVLMSVLLAFFISGCVYAPPHHEPAVHADDHYDPYDYYYYPEVRVYFHFSTGFYFYDDHGRWTRARVLPHHIIIHPRDRVRIKIKTKNPYQKHKDHHKKYVPRQRHNYKEDIQSGNRERKTNRRKHEDYKKNSTRRPRKRNDN